MIFFTCRVCCIFRDFNNTDYLIFFSSSFPLSLCDFCSVNLIWDIRSTFQFILKCCLLLSCDPNDTVYFSVCGQVRLVHQ